MTLDEAIRCLSVHSSTNGSGLCTDEQHYEAKQMGIEAIEQTRWIPVSERLPESSGVYIVTREFTDGFECADLTDACYFDGTSTWHDDNRINHGREYVDKKIKAWMPLPEPYKTERSGEESAIRTT